MEHPIRQARLALSTQDDQPAIRQVRTERIELRATTAERAQLEARALASGYGNLAQYLREMGLHSRNEISPASEYRQRLQWLQAANRLVDHVRSIDTKLIQGRQPDDDMLYYLLQIQEMIQDLCRQAAQRSKFNGAP